MMGSWPSPGVEKKVLCSKSQLLSVYYLETKLEVFFIESLLLNDILHLTIIL